jgi:hypothetical protein
VFLDWNNAKVGSIDTFSIHCESNERWDRLVKKIIESNFFHFLPFERSHVELIFGLEGQERGWVAIEAAFITLLVCE